ncbi:MrpH family fimbial adhesin [Pseudomonas sp. HLT2-19-2]
MNESNPALCIPFDKTQIPAGATMQQAREIWVRKHGVLSGELKADPLVTNPNCMSLVSVGNKFGKWLPGMSCVAVPPKNLICTATEQLNINYNTLESAHVNNAKSSANLSITCSGSASITLKLNGPREIDLGRSGALRATLDIQGKDLADGCSFKVGKNSTTVQVTSTLTSDSQEAESGEFKGNGVIVMSYN